jgi:VCBS repeat-containing protein
MAKGGNGNDQVVQTGTDENDVLTATADTTKINGGDGDDIITGGNGDDTIFGNDIAAFSDSILDNWDGTSGTWAEAKGNSWTVSTSEGTDTLKHIEALQFSDYTLAIDGSNNAVFAQADSGSTDEDNAATIDLLANDVDFDGDGMTVVSASSSVAGVVVTNNGDGTITYDPAGVYQHLALGEQVEDVVTYTVTDGNGGIATSTATITITGANDAPVANDDGLLGSVDEDQILSELLANDTDIDTTDILSVISVALDDPSLGTVTLDQSTGTLIYDPAGAFDDLVDGETAIVDLSYTVSDGNGGTDTGTFSLEIDGVGTACLIGHSFSNQTLQGTTGDNHLCMEVQQYAKANSFLAGAGDDLLSLTVNASNTLGSLIEGNLLSGGEGNDHLSLMAEQSGPSSQSMLMIDNSLLAGSGNDQINATITRHSSSGGVTLRQNLINGGSGNDTI